MFRKEIKNLLLPSNLYHKNSVLFLYIFLSSLHNTNYSISPLSSFDFHGVSYPWSAVVQKHPLSIFRRSVVAYYDSPQFMSLNRLYQATSSQE